MHETFVFYYNPKSEIETITGKIVNKVKHSIIGHFLTNQNKSKLIWISHLRLRHIEKDLIAGMVCYEDGNIFQGYSDKNTKIYIR